MRMALAPLGAAITQALSRCYSLTVRRVGASPISRKTKILHRPAKSRISGAFLRHCFEGS